MAHSKFRSFFLMATLFSLVALANPVASSAQLSDVEQQITMTVDRQFEDGLVFLERVVNINSGSGNHLGVRRVGAEFADAFAPLGFEPRWIDLPDSVISAGHLFLERPGTNGKRLLLIGHLDTVFEDDSPFQTFSRNDTIAMGPGVSDMKGGNTAMLQAIRALDAVGVLDGASIIIALMGDEEETGKPTSVSRAELVAAAQRSDAALAFEGGPGDLSTISVARRGISAWYLTVTGITGHSSLVFGDQYGYGSIYGAARILAAFQEELVGEEYLTFNPGTILGGTDVTYDRKTTRGTAFGKTNVIAQTTYVGGDLRTISVEQQDRVRNSMREIVAREIPGVTAEIDFQDAYPPMGPTDGNRALLAMVDQISRDMGDGPITEYDPGERGAADVSFVAPYVDGIDGLGAAGFEEHSPGEFVDLRTFPTVIKRAALLIYRLTR
jgi:glutamate carboxypeptidase